MQGEENGTHAYSAATPIIHSALIFPSLLCRCDPAGSKSKGEMCDVSPLLLVPSRVIRHWTIVYMHVLWL